MSAISPYSSSPGYIAQMTKTAVDEEEKKEETTGAPEASKESDNTEKTTDDPSTWEVVASSDPDEVTKEKEPEKVDEADAAEKAKEKEAAAAKLAEFKKAFQKKLNAICGQPQFSRTTIDLKINDAGYEKLMNDPAYEQKVIGLFRQELGSSLTFVPSSAILTVDGKTENMKVDYSGNLGYDRSRALLGTMAKPYLRGGMDIMQPQVMAVFKSRLGTTDIASLTGQTYSRANLFGKGGVNKLV